MTESLQVAGRLLGFATEHGFAGGIDNLWAPRDLSYEARDAGKLPDSYGGPHVPGSPVAVLMADYIALPKKIFARDDCSPVDSFGHDDLVTVGGSRALERPIDWFPWPYQLGRAICPNPANGQAASSYAYLEARSRTLFTKELHNSRFEHLLREVGKRHGRSYSPGVCVFTVEQREEAIALDIRKFRMKVGHDLDSTAGSRLVEPESSVYIAASAEFGGTLQISHYGYHIGHSIPYFA